MKKIILALAALLSIAASSAQVREYNYDVYYALGILHKRVASARVVTETSGDNFFGILHGSSVAWGGRIYSVRDTLRCRMSLSGQFPKVRENVEFQIGWYAKPLETELASGTFSYSNPSSYRNTHGHGTLDASHETMEAVAISTDMIGLFYLFEHIDFSQIEAKHTYLLPIGKPSGESHMDFRYEGPSTYELDGRRIPTYVAVIDYYVNGRPSGYPITCEVEQTTRVPLSFSAALKIGRFKMVRRF